MFGNDKKIAVNKNRLLRITFYRELLTKPRPDDRILLSVTSHELPGHNTDQGKTKT